MILSPEQCLLVLEEMRQSLLDRGAELIALCVAPTHVHALFRVTEVRLKPTFQERGLRTSAKDDPVRHLMGIAKQWSAKRLIRAGHFESGPIWGKRGKIVPIRDRAHQVNVFNYILRHGDDGSVVWSIRDRHDE